MTTLGDLEYPFFYKTVVLKHDNCSKLPLLGKLQSEQSFFGF